MLVSGLAVVALLVSCTEKGSAPSIPGAERTGAGTRSAAVSLATSIPLPLQRHALEPPHPTRCNGRRWWSASRYAEGTGPDVQINLRADYVKNPETPGPVQGQSNTYTLKSGECKVLWRNGESKPDTDIVTVSEIPVPGYTTTSQVTTVYRNEALPGPGSTFTKAQSAP